MLFRAAEKRRFQKEEEAGDAAIGLLQLCDYFLFSKHHIEHNPPTTRETLEPYRRLCREAPLKTTGSRKPNRRCAACTVKAKGQQQAEEGRKKKSMKPEMSAAKHLLQLCIGNNSDDCNKNFAFTPKLKEEEENCLKSHHHMGLIDTFKEEDDEHVDEESKSDVSNITDDCSDMETTLAEITAAQQIMQLSHSIHQQATTTADEEEEEEEEEEESTGFKINLSAASSSVVLSKRKDFEEENNSLLPRRKRKFHSLVDLYEITQPLEDDPYFD